MKNFFEKVWNSIKESFKNFGSKVTDKETWKELPKNTGRKIVIGLRGEGGITFSAALIAIFIGFIFSFFLMLIFNASSALPGLGAIFTAGAGNFGKVVFYATPIIITGLSVGFAFRTGLFNIGATGQFTVGAFAAIYVGIYGTGIWEPIHWLVAVLAAMVAGAIWGLIPGILKAYFNVHEVVATIMLNYVAMLNVSRFIQDYTLGHNQDESAGVWDSALIPRMGLDKIFPDNNVTGAFWIAILAVIIVYIILQKTTFGFQLKAVGLNRDAAKYAGVNSKMNIVYAMTIAGLLSGLAGAVVVLSPALERISVAYILRPEGFDGIAVALLGVSNPFGILGAGLFFGYIKEAALPLQRVGFEKEIINMIISSIIYLSALAIVFKKYSSKLLKKLPDYNDDDAFQSEGGDEK
jgi:simple sugar transport system permease protein